MLYIHMLYIYISVIYIYIYIYMLYIYVIYITRQHLVSYHPPVCFCMRCVIYDIKFLRYYIDVTCTVYRYIIPSPPILRLPTDPVTGAQDFLLPAEHPPVPVPLPGGVEATGCHGWNTYNYI